MTIETKFGYPSAYLYFLVYNKVESAILDNINISYSRMKVPIITYTFSINSFPITKLEHEVFATKEELLKSL